MDLRAGGNQDGQVIILYHSSCRCGTPRMSAWKPRWLSSSKA